MRNYLLILFLLVMTSECLPKATSVDTNVQHKDTIFVFDSKGKTPFVIFPKDITIPLKIERVKARYTPSMQDVKNAELILLERYNEVRTIDARGLKHKKIKNVEKKLKGYIHQYVGIINQEDDKILLVQLIKYSTSKSKQKYFENWRTEFIVGFGNFYEKNSEIYLINIKNGEISIF